MKHWIACFLLVAGLLSGGCDSINQSQIQVMPARTAPGTAVAAAPATEREAVKQALQQIALKHKFEDRTALALHPDVLCDYYQPVTVQPPSKNPMRLTAWVSGDKIIIDLSQKSIEGGESIAYQNLRNQIVTELTERFGTRVTQVPKNRQASARVQHTP